MEQQELESTINTSISEPNLVMGELGLLVPLVAPVMACVVKGVMEAIARRQKAKIENQIDTREFLQQQNELLLRKLLGNKSDSPKD